jgi:hypothetical protein
VAHGEDYQFNIPKRLVPGLNASPETALNFWAALVASHPILGCFASREFLKDNPDLMDRIQANYDRVVEIWQMNREADELKEWHRKCKVDAIYTFEQMQVIGDEALESFHGGRWYELSPLGMNLLTNAFQSSPLDPEAPENQCLKVTFDSLSVILMLLNKVSKKWSYSIIAPSCSDHMKELCVYKEALIFFE